MLDLDRVQLERIERAISALHCRPPAEREKRYHLLKALEAERQELLQYNPRSVARLTRKAA